jgi:hypothetical protein
MLGKHLFHSYGPDLVVHVHLGLYGTFTDVLLPVEPPRRQVRMRLVGSTHWTDLRGPAACELLTDAEVDLIRARLGPDPLRPDADPDRAWEGHSCAATTTPWRSITSAGPSIRSNCPTAFTRVSGSCCAVGFGAVRNQSGSLSDMRGKYAPHMEGEEMQIKGHNGTVSFNGVAVMITRRGFLRRQLALAVLLNEVENLIAVAILYILGATMGSLSETPGLTTIASVFLTQGAFCSSFLVALIFQYFASKVFKYFSMDSFSRHCVSYSIVGIVNALLVTAISLVIYVA